METVISFFQDPKALLYFRGWVYLYIAIVMALSTLADTTEPRTRNERRIHKAQKIVLACLFACMAAGGISAWLGFPEFGQKAISHGATLFATIYAVFVTYFLIFRK